MSRFEELPKKFNASFFSDASAGVADAFLGSRSLPVRTCAALVFLLASLALILSFVFQEEKVRHVFLFPAVPSSAETEFPAAVPEVRYLVCPEDASGRLALYVGELLLGPAEPGASPIFQAECRLSDCFVRGDAAFVNVTAVSSVDTLTDPFFQNQCDLFKKNVCINFKDVGKIHLYFDGIEVYGEKR